MNLHPHVTSLSLPSLVLIQVVNFLGKPAGAALSGSVTESGSGLKRKRDAGGKAARTDAAGGKFARKNDASGAEKDLTAAWLARMARQALQRSGNVVESSVVAAGQRGKPGVTLPASTSIVVAGAGSSGGLPVVRATRPWHVLAPGGETEAVVRAMGLTQTDEPAAAAASPASSCASSAQVDAAVAAKARVPETALVTAVPVALPPGTWLSTHHRAAAIGKASAPLPKPRRPSAPTVGLYCSISLSAEVSAASSAAPFPSVVASAASAIAGSVPAVPVEGGSRRLSREPLPAAAASSGTSNSSRRRDRTAGNRKRPPESVTLADVEEDCSLGKAPAPNATEGQAAHDDYSFDKVVSVSPCLDEGCHSYRIIMAAVTAGSVGADWEAAKQPRSVSSMCVCHSAVGFFCTSAPHLRHASLQFLWPSKWASSQSSHSLISVATLRCY